jgi:phosphatidylinositol alpha-mannosyltransferase
VNVAIVSPYDLGLPGGVQDQVVRLSRWLEDLGHGSIVIGPGVEGPDGAILLGSTRAIRANRASTPIGLDPRISKRVKEAVQRADVVHIHEPLMPIVSTSATAISTHPTVGTFHADPPNWARFGYRVGSLIWKKAINRLDVVTTVSQVSGSAIAPFARARVIPNGIDIADYNSIVKSPYRVAFLGRDDERKGLQVLLDAWPCVIDAVPEAELRVIGAMRDDQIVGVTFLGRIEEDEKRAELGRAEIFCAPNLGGESFGIVVAEGMASGCAVVASGIPAFVGVLGASGVFVLAGDVRGLADAVISLLTNRRLLADKQRAAQAAVVGFDGSSVARMYVTAYEDAIALHQS